MSIAKTTKDQSHHYKHKTYRQHKTLNPYLLIITLNVNGLNVPAKRHRVSEWIKKKQDPSICCLQETHFRPEDTFRLKVRGWRTIYHSTGSQKKAGVAILTSDKPDFKGCNKR